MSLSSLIEDAVFEQAKGVYFTGVTDKDSYNLARECSSFPQLK